MSALSKTRRLSTWMLGFCGVWLIGLGLYFIFLRPALLPEDSRFMAMTLPQVTTAVPGLESWLKKVFTVLGGFIAGSGVLTLFVARAVMPLRLKGTSWALGFSGLLTVVLMSVTNFVLVSDFRWVLMLPALIWAAAVALYRVGR